MAPNFSPSVALTARGGRCLTTQQALVKFNQKLADNKQLREQIDSLRRERGMV